MLRCIVMNEKDDMATVLSPVKPGDELEIIDRVFAPKGCVTASAEIPFAHKIALRSIACGEMVVKCGEIIGKATKDIPQGDYLHVHNVQSLAGTQSIKEA
ncbi:MAG: UxaA family hydrolase [Clostridia bacterium]|nr:UxaA family hydrolase [Clostridia bacterium]